MEWAWHAFANAVIDILYLNLPKPSQTNMQSKHLDAI